MKPRINQVFLEISTKVHYKVVGHSENSDDVYAIPIKNDKPLGMPKRLFSNYFDDTEKFRQLDFDPFKIDRKEEELTNAEKETRDAWNQIIKPIIDDQNSFDPIWRNKEINFIAKRKNGIGRTRIYALIKRAWAFGPDDNALLPRFQNRGGPGKRKKMTDKMLGRTNAVPKKGLVLTPSDIEKIGKGFKKYYVKNPKNTLRSARIEFLASENYKEDAAPTLKQFIYWGRQENDPYEIVTERAGKVKTEKDIRTLHGTARDNVYGPGSEVMIDMTIDNVRAVQASNPERYIGRLSVYLGVDVYSGMVTALYVSPEHAAYTTGCMCLINMAEDKVDFCKRFDIEITEDEWPCHYLPGRLLADRGELISNMSSSLTTNLKIDLSNTPSYRAELKAYVEKQFNIFQSKLKGLLYMNGLVDKKDEPRITMDSRKQAFLNMNDITNLIIQEILFFNKHHWMSDYPMTPEMRAEIKEPTPLNIWNWGITKGLGNLRRLDKHVIWRNCLPRKSAVVSREGIYVEPHHFITANRNDEHILHKIRFSGNNSCEIVFHPSYFKETYLISDGNFYPLAPRAQVDYLNYFEFEDFVQDDSERKVLHEREAEKKEIEKTRYQKQRIENARKRKAKKVVINDGRKFRQEEIDFHREKIMPDLQSPENKTIQTHEKSSNYQSARSNSPLPSFINDLQKLKI